MTTRENKETIRRFWEEVFNQRRFKLVDEFFTNDYMYHGAGGQEAKGTAELGKLLGMYFNAFPDLHAEVEDIFGEEDKVMSRAMCTGTHLGELMGMPPTGKKIAIRVICADRFRKDKVAESYELPDLFGMMVQIGAIPAGAKA
jgi:steroid delta-isomerase-like uncharacterized protein